MFVYSFRYSFRYFCTESLIRSYAYGLSMSSRDEFLKALQRQKGILDEMRVARRAELRARGIKALLRPTYEKEGVFKVPRTAERLIGTILRPFSARFATVLRRGYRKTIYRDRATGRFVRKTLVNVERSKFRAQNAARVFAQRFKGLMVDELAARVNRLTELGIRKQMGEDVDIEIAELFGYPE